MLRRSESERSESESSSWRDRLPGESESQSEHSSGGLRSRLGRESEEPSDDTSSGWFGRARAKYGLGAVLVAIGVVLFLIPEPATSTAGIFMIGVGAVIWIVSLLR